MSRNTLYSTLLHLTLSPLLFFPARGSATAASNIYRAPTGSLYVNQSSNLRSFSALYLHCPSLLVPHQPFSTSSMMSSDPVKSAEAADQNQDQDGKPKAPLALPSTDPTDGSNSHKIDLSAEGGSTVKLDHFGPMVVNQDGTLSRISNWEQMTEIERRNTLRVLGKRNKQRLAALKEAEAARQNEEQK
ncbi:hypothetical protein ASPZODRAFT_134944 [Penicilliopsis zonata CBS 506.65]|uniref:BZIP domain-containing protein n=1 Tax=Penicilliopsis zonata CBS 506.65 TaxID=1073090 RepID=A0A1L9SCA5_9EURO|nr:hypothetical protein ASPZODRAFT_134944 [Penicilliopsis zonata CBS 506.65]OJJ44806.1 hypothetical protein ASPZODRAFT_134944 [Penicilliopsis zonata CBS 506.65]